MTEPIQTQRELINWWEKRRIKYNLTFILSGIVILAYIWFANRAAINFFIIPLLVIYVFLMNICYLGIWILLILLKRRYSIGLFKYSNFLFESFLFGSILLNVFWGLILLYTKTNPHLYNH